MAARRRSKTEGKDTKPRNGNGGQLGFEAKLWQAADALRNNGKASAPQLAITHTGVVSTST